MLDSLHYTLLLKICEVNLIMFVVIKKFLRWLRLKNSSKQKLSEKFSKIHRRLPISNLEFIKLMKQPINDEELVDKVRNIVAKEIVSKQGRINGCLLYPEDRLVEDLGICSFDALDYTAIIIQLEHILNISIPDEEAMSVKTVEDLIHICARHRIKLRHR